jgi:hypothetical protein
MWISVNLDVGSNFCEFSHILAGSRMQPLMVAKSWLVPGCSQQAGSRQQAIVGVAYVSIMGVN